MRSFVCIVLVASLSLATSNILGADRVLRETGLSREQLANSHNQPFQIDDVDTLHYETPGNPPYFMWLPDAFGDDFLNVRFTPPFDPYYVVGVLMPLFDMDSIRGGPAGTPGVKISVWESGFDEGGDSAGFPTDLIGSIDFPYFDEENDSVFIKLCRANNLVWNYFDLRPLRIGPREGEFHVAASVLSDQETDTLAIFHDDGRGQFRSDRSGLWNGQDSIWSKMKYLPGIRLGLNFYMHVVISDTIPWSVDYENDFRPPTTVLLDPAYPNPFNNRTSLRFAVPISSPYQIQLFDRQGRRIRLLGEGKGGSGVLALDAASLTSGTYFITLTTPNGVSTQPIHLIR